MLVFYDKQPNGAYPTYADLLSNNDQAPTFESGVSPVNRSRFVIIRDQNLVIDPAMTLTTPVKLYAKGRWEVEYGTNTGLIGDMRTGAIHIMAFGNLSFLGGTGSTGPIWQNLHARIRYVDN